MTHKGGLRSSIKLGTSQSILSDSLLALAIDTFSIGIIFSILFYHFALYLLRRKYSSDFIFALLSLNVLFLAMFFGEQSIMFMIPEIPLGVQLRASSFLIYLLPPLVLLFIYRLYDGLISVRILFFLALFSFIFMLVLFFDPVYFQRWSIVYYIVGGLFTCLVALLSTFKAFRSGRPGAGLLFSGFIVLMLITGYAIFLFYTDHLAGSYISAGFALFMLFQSGAIAHNHAALEKQNDIINKRLFENSIILESQRKEIEMNLHDSIGGSLTDLKILLQNVLQEHRYGNPTIIPDLEKALSRTDKTITSMRTQLLFLEDLKLAMKDIISGLQLILLRRYQETKKKVRIEVEPGLQEIISELDRRIIIPELFKLNLTLAVQEICSNNLKYGIGEACWQFSLKENILMITAENKVGRKRKKISVDNYGTGNLQSRLAKINGKIEIETKTDSYRILLTVPLPDQL